MPDITIVRDYAYPPLLVWQAMTVPELVARWTTTGRGGRPEGFEPRVGCEFRFVAKPLPGWDGIVHCEVLEVRAPKLLRFSWRGAEDERPTEVTYRIEPHGDGARLTYLHTGFTGIGGQLMSRLLGRVRRKMLDKGLPAVLIEIERTSPVSR
jgi:uncharacterized protein YndB with AHSA1/START domain